MYFCGLQEFFCPKTSAIAEGPQVRNLADFAIYGINLRTGHLCNLDSYILYQQDLNPAKKRGKTQARSHCSFCLPVWINGPGKL